MKIRENVILLKKIHEKLFFSHLRKIQIANIKIIFYVFLLKKIYIFLRKFLILCVYRYIEFDRKENSRKESIRVYYLDIDQELIVFHDCGKIAGDISAD